MKTAALTRPDLNSGSLVLVNAQHAIVQNDADAADLVPAMEAYPDILLRREATIALREALMFIGAAGDIVPVSGYRPYAEQMQIFNASLRDNGEDFTRRFVALPGHSEHQSGLAIDLALRSEQIDFICPDFPYDGICQRFRQVAPDFGFVERYPAEKQDITGIAHEPWHFRYVGRPHARIMTDRGLTLEEYVGFIKAYRADNRLVSGEFEVYYIPQSGAPLERPAGSVDISGNNVDGFIVTAGTGQ